ncbi:hypothetical protein MRBLAR21_002556 [Paenarthrobacter nitroguajacolicus]
MDAVAEAADDRDTWDVPEPSGGWGTPWPQCVELARALPSTQWTLVGGLMVQLHAAAAGLAISRPTANVDIVLPDPGHRSWQLLDPADRTPAMDALRILAANHSLPPANRLKSG